MAHLLDSFPEYRWQRRFSPESAAELLRQISAGEHLSDVLRRARDWRSDSIAEERALDADMARFDADH